MSQPHKNIHTLIADVNELIQTKGWFTDELAAGLSKDISLRVGGQFADEVRTPTLRLSQMGPRCPCALWHSLHKPELAEALPPWAQVKYSFGHILEALAITLARAAGHTVEGIGDAVYVDGVTGHRDCVIDGCLVDVKSTSSFGFKRFKDGSIEADDPFGYMAQLDGYLVGSAEDPIVRVKDRAYDWAIDKQLGHMVLHEHRLREPYIRAQISDYKQIADLTSPPVCTCGTVEEGKSGNIKLDSKASYNLYKHSCFPRLRTFLYKSGPVYLTKVVRKPDVTEVDRHGNVIYS